MARAPKNTSQNDDGNLSNLQFGIAEYKEISENIRVSWNYITNLLRHYLLMQIILISLVGLGNTLIPSGFEHTYIPVNNSDKIDTYKKIPLTDDQKEKAELNLKYQAAIKHFSLFILMVVGAGFSLGARTQSKRLFYNAENFVKRAAELEEEYGVGKIKGSHSTHQYMLNRLSQTDLFKMENALSFVYTCGIMVWGILFIGIAIYISIYAWLSFY